MIPERQNNLHLQIYAMCYEMLTASLKKHILEIFTIYWNTWIS